MLSKLTQLFSTDIAVDLGTANTLIFAKNRGIVLNEPSAVVVKRSGNFSQKTSVVAVGTEAKAMLGRVPNNLEAIRPMKDGVIADFTLTELMLKHVIKTLHGEFFFRPRPRPRIVICVPSGSTQVERPAIKESALGAGAVQVYLIEEPMAAALGVGLPVAAPLSGLLTAVKLALEQTPSGLNFDIADKGVILTVGGAILKCIGHFIRENTGLPVSIADDPLMCVVKGCGMALERFAMPNIFSYD